MAHCENSYKTLKFAGVVLCPLYSNVYNGKFALDKFCIYDTSMRKLMNHSYSQKYRYLIAIHVIKNLLFYTTVDIRKTLSR